MSDPECRLFVPIQVWKDVFIPGRGQNVRFVFFQQRYGGDWKLWIPIGISRGMDFDSLAQLVSQDVVGTDITGTNAVRSVFGQCLPGSSITQLECPCTNGADIMKPINQTQMNQTDL